MVKLIINAINDEGKRTSFHITAVNGEHYLMWDNNPVCCCRDENGEIKARDRAEYIMRQYGYHLEELVKLNENDFAYAITFELADPDTVVTKYLEWMGGRYVQLGPEERLSKKLAEESYGYC